ncbi:MAG: hypothetical protein RL199_2081 [Pseudomonadota bacterium]|jgi:hypothetical protein
MAVEGSARQVKPANAVLPDDDAPPAKHAAYFKAVTGIDPAADPLVQIAAVAARAEAVRQSATSFLEFAREAIASSRQVGLGGPVFDSPNRGAILNLDVDDDWLDFWWKDLVAGWTKFEEAYSSIEPTLVAIAGTHGGKIGKGEGQKVEYPATRVFVGVLDALWQAAKRPSMKDATLLSGARAYLRARDLPRGTEDVPAETSIRDQKRTARKNMTKHIAKLRTLAGLPGSEAPPEVRALCAAMRQRANRTRREFDSVSSFVNDVLSPPTPHESDGADDIESWTVV